MIKTAELERDTETDQWGRLLIQKHIPYLVTWYWTERYHYQQAEKTVNRQGWANWPTMEKKKNRFLSYFIHRLQIVWKAVKLLEENIAEYFYDIGGREAVTQIKQMTGMNVLIGRFWSCITKDTRQSEKTSQREYICHPYRVTEN